MNVMLREFTIYVRKDKGFIVSF